MLRQPTLPINVNFPVPTNPQPQDLMLQSIEDQYAKQRYSINKYTEQTVKQKKCNVVLHDQQIGSPSY